MHTRYIWAFTKNHIKLKVIKYINYFARNVTISYVTILRLIVSPFSTILIFQEENI